MGVVVVDTHTHPRDDAAQHHHSDGCPENHAPSDAGEGAHAAPPTTRSLQPTDTCFLRSVSHDFSPSVICLASGTRSIARSHRAPKGAAVLAGTDACDYR